MHVQLEPIRVETGSADEDGRLVIYKGKLVGILVRIAEPGVWKGYWSVEWIAGMLHHPPPFATTGEAADWFSDRFAQGGLK